MIGTLLAYLLFAFRTPSVPSNSHSTARRMHAALLLLIFGVLAGTLMGSITSIGWLNGQVGAKFVLTYAATGATLGVVGTCVGGLIILFLRWLTRVTTRRPVAGADQSPPQANPQPPSPPCGAGPGPVVN